MKEVDQFKINSIEGDDLVVTIKFKISSLNSEVADIGTQLENFTDEVAIEKEKLRSLKIKKELGEATEKQVIAQTKAVEDAIVKQSQDKKQLLDSLEFKKEALSVLDVALQQAKESALAKQLSYADSFVNKTLNQHLEDVEHMLLVIHQLNEAFLFLKAHKKVNAYDGIFHEVPTAISMIHLLFHKDKSYEQFQKRKNLLWAEGYCKDLHSQLLSTGS